MKKFCVTVIVIIMVVLSFCSCGKTEQPEQAKNDGNNMVINPISEITPADMARELGLKKIEFNGIQDTVKIDGNYVIYQIDCALGSKKMNLRLAKASTDVPGDISGIYLNGKPDSAVYDSADIIKHPSVQVQKDSTYIKAYGDWNGYVFSVSSFEKLTLDEMQKLTVDLLAEVICTDNIQTEKPAETTAADNTSSETEEKTEAVNESPVKAELTTALADTINMFIVKETDGTKLTLSRYEVGNGELKEGLYTCNYGNLYGSYAMIFNVGDIITVRYYNENKETYPYQIEVAEINPAEWN